MAEKPYWQTLRDLKLGKTPEKDKAKKTETQELKEFFQAQIRFCPAKCTNCDANLGATKAINPAAPIAHILPKSKFKSIATNEANIIILCIDCHSLLDTGGEKKVRAMKVFETLKSRVKFLLPDIAESEKRFIPKYYQP